MIVYDGGVRRLIATHEAGHAVAHLLLGHHVLDTEIRTAGGHARPGGVLGNTRYASLAPDGGLADLVGVAAGEAAVAHLLIREWHPNPELVARASADHDREHAARIAIETTLPAGIETKLASQIVADHWDAVTRVADALRRADDGRLDFAEVWAAADVRGAEIGWDELSAMAEAAMPSDAGLRSYLAGPGREQENARAEFLQRLWDHNVLCSPADASRRQLTCEIHDRGTEIQAALDAPESKGVSR